MTDHTAIVVWLTITGLASLAQTALLMWVVVSADQRWRQSEAALKALERDHLAPLVSRLELTLVDLQDTAARAKQADEDVRWAVRQAADRAVTFARSARAALWPVWGVMQGVRAATSVLIAPRVTARARARAFDEDAVARLVYEGGKPYVRNCTHL